MGRNSSRLWKKIAFFAGSASLVSFVISALCPNYVNENGWLAQNFVLKANKEVK